MNEDQPGRICMWTLQQDRFSISPSLSRRVPLISPSITGSLFKQKPLLCTKYHWFFIERRVRQNEPSHQPSPNRISKWSLTKQVVYTFSHPPSQVAARFALSCHVKILPEASLAAAANLNEGGSCLDSLIKETVSYATLNPSSYLAHHIASAITKVYALAQPGFLPRQGKNPVSLGWNIKIPPRGKNGWRHNHEKGNESIWRNWRHVPRAELLEAWLALTIG